MKNISVSITPSNYLSLCSFYVYDRYILPSLNFIKIEIFFIYTKQIASHKCLIIFSECINATTQLFDLFRFFSIDFP